MTATPSKPSKPREIPSNARSSAWQRVAVNERSAAEEDVAPGSSLCMSARPTLQSCWHSGASRGWRTCTNWPWACPTSRSNTGRMATPSIRSAASRSCSSATLAPTPSTPRPGSAYTDVIVFWVASESDKHALVQDQISPFFTTPHFDGHQSVLLRACRIGELSLQELTEVVQDAWLFQGDMRVPGPVAADLVVIESGFVLRGLAALLDLPTSLRRGGSARVPACSPGPRNGRTPAQKSCPGAGRFVGEPAANDPIPPRDHR